MGSATKISEIFKNSILISGTISLLIHFSSIFYMIDERNIKGWDRYRFNIFRFYNMIEFIYAHIYEFSNYYVNNLRELIEIKRIDYMKEARYEYKIN